MALNVWTKSSGYNFGTPPGTNLTVSSGSFIPGLQYVITSIGTTDFKKIGASQNSVGVVFTALNTGSEAGPLVAHPVTNIQAPTPGTGIASRVAFSERRSLNLELPVVNETGVNFNIISGGLPPGLRLEGKNIVGSAFEVSRVTEFKFCIRASKNGEISDRTFYITIEGTDEPTFVTPEGFINLGDPGELFVMDSTFVDYQLTAIDTDTSAGQRLSYFIAKDDGSLPPGLVLTEDGRIVGFVQPTLSIKPADGDGTFDNSYFDAVAYDFAFRPSNGYDSYVFDTVFYDFALQSGKPKKLNRTYQFTVTVTDGDTFTKRTFKIFVVGDDYFRADNTTWLDGDTMFTADVTYMRAPMWLTSSNLGLHRANNYITLILDTYDTENIIYSLEQINANTRATTKRLSPTDNISGGYTVTTTLTTNTPTVGHFLTFSGLVQEATVINRVDAVTSLGNGNYRLTMFYPLEVTIPDNIEFLIGTLSSLPPGMQFDENNAEVHGLVPYQPAITKTYTFTVTATKISGKINLAEYIILPTNVGVKINQIKISKITYPDISTILKDFSNMSVDSTFIDPAFVSSIDYSSPTEVIINLSTNIILTSSSKVSIKYAVTAGERSSTPKIFTVDILGEVDSAIQWVTPSDLGTINANFISTLSVNATSSIPGSTILYNFISGRLPPGLSLDLDGEIVGKVNQYGNPTTGVSGLTTFDFQINVTTFDGGLTSVDEAYEFVVEARDQFGYSAVRRTFRIAIDTPNQLVYSNIRVKPFLKLEQRSVWRQFIDDTSVFTPTSIYRPNDPSFGIQKELSMLVFAGIETKEAAAYISAMGLNHKRKRFQFKGVSKATAIKPGTIDEIYEVVYIEMLDPLEPNGNRLPNKIEKLGLQPNTITVDKSNIIWSRRINDLNITAPDSIRPEPIITVDSRGYEVSNPNVNEYFPNSISNWRDRLKNWADDGESFAIERNYLPLWMRSIQPGTKEELDFKLAVPLCYCKPGTADNILLNIKNYIKTNNFSFNQLDYTADRYIIDSVAGLTQDKYLVFRNDRITI
jgi:hypothetical protein